MIQKMENSFLSQLVNGMTGSDALSQSRLYSRWSVCGDEPVASPVPEFREKSSPLTLADPGKRLDMFGLVPAIPEEPKLEPVTDWNSLSKLFPPLWSSNIEQGELSDYLPSNVLDSDSQAYRADSRSLPDMESLQRGFEDLGLLESFVSHPETQLEELVSDIYIENPTLKPNSAFHRPERSVQYPCDYIKYNRADYAANDSVIGPDAQKRSHEFSGFPMQAWKGDTGRERFVKPNPQNCSHNSRDAWSKENYLKMCDVEPLVAKQPVPQYNQSFNKERGFQQFSQRKPYNLGSENRYNYPSIPFDSRDNQAYQGLSESFSKSSSNTMYHNENLHPSCFVNRWLDCEVPGRQKQATSPLPSPVSSTLSDGSPTHPSLSQLPHYSHASPSSLSDGHMQSDPKTLFSGLIAESQRCGKSYGRSSPNKDGNHGKPVFGMQAPKSPTQQNLVAGSDRYHRLPKKNSPQSDTNTERRGRRNWGAQGNARPGPQQFNMFHKKQEPNVGNVSDFINASFLPPFSLMSNIKQNQNFPPFNPQTFSPPTNMSFPPPPFPFSDLIDLLHYDDLNPLNPFISDLFCSDVSPPYVSFPSQFNRYRPPRNRSGPASELHSQLEECCEQLKSLEKERKKTEADLARHFPGNRVSSSYSSTIPRLPTNPSRVDRLIVDELREQARAVSLVKIMERLSSSALHVNISLALEHHLEAIHLTQARRKDEIVNVANRQKQGTPRFNNERDVLALAAAIKEMVSSTRKARTALWCALQMTLPKSSSGSAAVTQEDLERLLQELCPRKLPGCIDDGCKKECDGKSLIDP